MNDLGLELAYNFEFQDLFLEAVAGKPQSASHTAEGPV